MWSGSPIARMTAAFIAPPCHVLAFRSSRYYTGNSAVRSGRRASSPGARPPGLADVFLEGRDIESLGRDGMKPLSRILLATALASLAAAGGSPQSGAAGMSACGASARAAFQSCKLETQSAARLALGRCNNLADPGARKACQQQASTEAKDQQASCREQNGLRRGVC